MNQHSRTGLLLAPLLAVSIAAGCRSMPDAEAEAGPASAYTPAAEGALYHFGYALGDTVASLELDGSEIDEVVEGLRDRARGRDPRYGTLADHQAEIGAFFDQRSREVGEIRFAAERPYLEEAASAPGVHTTESGAVVRVLEAGTGAPPESGQRLRMHYDGELIDGTPVRSTRSGPPYELVFDRANRCWREALQGWGAAGASLVVTCPPDLLFGIKGKSGWAPPGAVVVWQIDVLEVEGP